MSKMVHFIGLDDDAPPAKRLKLRLTKRLSDPEIIDLNNNIQNDEDRELGFASPKSDVRKRKIAVKRPVEKSISDLNPYAILEIFDYLPLNDLCNMAQSNKYFAYLAGKVFQQRYPNGLRMRTIGRGDIELLIRVLNTFGNLITAAEFSTNHRR